jgi:hypothetical protein
MNRGCRTASTLLASAALSLLLLAPADLTAQGGRFLAVGGGAAIPVGTSGDAMNTGLITEFMAGITLPNQILALRAGGNYVRTNIKPLAAGGPLGGTMGGMETAGGTSRLLCAMIGGMFMPIAIGSAVPYLAADAGVVRATYEGTRSSFVGQAGAGLMVQTERLGIYVESRFMQARRDGHQGSMVPLTTGVRIAW